MSYSIARIITDRIGHQDMLNSKTIYSNTGKENISKEEMEKYKKTMLDMLVDIAAVCEKHDIPYILAYGTLLGAVRHKGYIPWDDDIDIHVKSKDMLRFKEAIQAELGDKYVFVENLKKPVYFEMIEIPNTKVYEFGDDNEKLVRGIKIDIFPFEPVSENKTYEKLNHIGKKIIIRMNSLRKNFLYPSKSMFKNTTLKVKIYYSARVLVGMLCAILPTSFYYKAYNHLAGKGKTDKQLNIVLENVILPAEIMDRRIKLDFEGHEFYCPENYDLYLTKIYGSDYMELPPEDKREIHSVMKIIF